MVKVPQKEAPKEPQDQHFVKDQQSDAADSIEPIPVKKRNQPKQSGSQTKRQQTEEYLKQRFKFRFNEITGGVEFSKTAQNTFVELTDYRLNSLCRDIDAYEGLNISPKTLLDYLRSDFVDSFHPFRQYFSDLPDRSGTVTIEQLAATIQVKNPEVFLESLTRWMVAAVANAFTENDCQNQTCLVLTGDQGAFKTTWLNWLCPKILERYRLTGKIDLKSKDTLILLATQFMVNLDDQLRELNKTDAETVKTLISHGNVTVRRPFDRVASFLSRAASFCASINSPDFLTDSTGSRRFLPFEVASIDIDQAQKLNIDHAWAEAYKLWQSGYQYWFTKQETADLFGTNEDFAVTTHEYELLHEYYEVVEQEEHANVKLTPTQLLIALQSNSRLQLSVRKLGEALKKSKATKRTDRKAGKGNGKVYLLRERGQTERDEQRDLAS